MAKDSDPLADAFGTKETGGLFSGLLAEESAFDRRMMWRLGSWGVAAVGAVVIAVMANQAQLGWRRDQMASADLVRQADRLQLLTRESQNEARRLAAAVETLNADRDRLYSRVTVLEQGLDSVTGAIARQSAKPQDTPAPDAQPAAPSVAPVASMPSPSSDKPRAAAAKEQAKEATKDTVKETAKEPSSPPPQSAAAASLVQQSPATTSALPMLPLVPSKSIMAPPDPAASKLTQPETTEKTTEKTAEKKPEPTPAPTEITAASAKPPEATESEAPAIAVQQTRFAIDLGGANSIDGLRALWRGVTKSNPEVATLRPIIMIKEGTTGLGMQLRLGAGPLINAAAAAKLCAGLAENDRHCETTVFDGQRLSMRGGSEKGQEKSQDRVQEKNAEKNPDAAPQAETAPAPAPTAKPDKRRRSYSSKRSSKREEPAPAPAAQPAAPAKPETAAAGSTLSSFFRR
ncbi:MULTISPECIES: hypothetical protein [Bradyrhizobium]|uniref:Blr4609 protein n=1 Tax=Bradyrhizobium diazoefficiens (strain JCM 10833 / BCRC 13528 / IAM 13628 / NBRC 14792 / USDA 110) TaxID=224911 RepID=Q89LD6_BRADU|nr:hypothetical protein [Bradyrhizobium diazoefficiens]MBP1065337.1 hypothetical protein [Bradyrhizobium japonicum]AND89880.1 hypothetical protein AAV28_20285 [Bradyrhizobium diazoefficiens USDA 110]AWO91540.1 hypothetical protein DI395_25610 [Bradyrhizobium diazoefficiens]PDT56861.1 hypothetical protein CO678_36485 [Bradyrhizobium diazoefficiens]QBP23383.1 hypothetical protein Bdiaspc4_24100 [Bradyrhizobium diazoefficiens]